MRAPKRSAPTASARPRSTRRCGRARRRSTGCATRMRAPSWRCCACPRRPTISRRSEARPRGSPQARATSSCSAPAAPRSGGRAARQPPPAGGGVRGAEAFRAGPRMHFMDNLDPVTFGTLLGRLPLATTRFVAVSKSGGTGETLMQTAAALDAVKRGGLEGRIGELFLGISEVEKPGRTNGLRALLGPSVTMLEHDPGIGGRFSVLSNVGLLPAAVLGLDISVLRRGAESALAPVLAGKPAAEVPAALGASVIVALAAQNKTIAVLMAYADRLERFSRWYAQLWAESLGKDGKGTTPIGALGPVDQHSQLQ